MASSIHILGIRHHGPGSARSLVAALEHIKPDALLIEGPPDAADILELARHESMRPPVALLIYDPARPSRGVFYPFAAFSPEWNAIRWGLTHNAAVRFMDLPHTHRFALEAQHAAAAESDEAAPASEDEPAPHADEPNAKRDHPDDPRLDPLHHLAQAAGDADGERWWDRMIESRRDRGGPGALELFAAVHEAMAALRAELGERPDPEEQLREAWMRKTIRAAIKDGFQRIAVVCGAWHAPALADLPPAAKDNDLLKGLPKAKVAATWIPWTHGRLCFRSGYGAGVESPGWYDHLWTCADAVTERWMTRVARLLRNQDLDASSAQVIDAVRLAEAAAALRGRPLPSLAELTEATEAVLAGGNPLHLRLVHDRLIVGESLGAVPEDAPTVPLQRDLERLQTSLRLKPSAEEKLLDLDLRKENDLARSHLLHRLSILGVEWGVPETARGKAGTFHEFWRLRWRPELSIAVIEAGVWGNTVEEAARNRAIGKADAAPDLPALTALLDHVLLAELPEAAERLTARIASAAAIASDIGHLMDAAPPLARVARYGNVRRTDAEMVAGVLRGLTARIAVGLPAACVGLNDEAAAAMLARIDAVHDAISAAREPDQLDLWREALRRVGEADASAPLLAGRAWRMLLDAGASDPAEVGTRMSLALSRAADPSRAAAWIEGFLGHSGLVLLHDRALWTLLDGWLSQLRAEDFTTVVPLLRRSFSRFASGERRQLGELAQRTAGGAAIAITESAAADFDLDRAEAVLPVLELMLDLGATP